MLLASSRFCPQCGHERDEIVDHGMDAAQALVRAASLYAVLLVTGLWNLGAILHGWAMPLAASASDLVVGAVGTVFVRRHARGWLVRPRWTLRGSLLTAAALTFALVSANALGLIVEMSDDLMLIEYGEPGGDGMWLALFIIAGLVPLLEEWLFRGVLLELLLAVFPRHTAVIVTALLFAFAHLSPPTIVHHGMLGYVCGRVRLGTGSLWTAIACHAAYNATVVVSTWYA